jgi:hypothetical protein
MARVAVLCSNCHAGHGQWLPSSGRLSTLDYFCCGYCGCVWTTPKDKPAAIPTLVSLPAVSAPQRTH